MTLKELEEKLKLNNTQVSQLKEYAEFLVEYNEKINLTAITNFEDIIEKHFYDSLIMTTHKDIKGTLVDVGTGAGFPGVVLKIYKPDLKVILLEPINKRCVFLKELINRLNLKDIEVINVRGEDYVKDHREEYDYVTARAVTNLNALIEICGGLVKVNGYFIALRGKDGNLELESAEKAIKQMGFIKEDVYVDELSDSSTRVTAFLKKQERTAKKFPRKYSIIKSNPL